MTWMISNLVFSISSAGLVASALTGVITLAITATSLVPISSLKVCATALQNGQQRAAAFAKEAAKEKGKRQKAKGSTRFIDRRNMAGLLVGIGLIPILRANGREKKTIWRRATAIL